MVPLALEGELPLVALAVQVVGAVPLHSVRHLHHSEAHGGNARHLRQPPDHDVRPLRQCVSGGLLLSVPPHLLGEPLEQQAHGPQAQHSPAHVILHHGPVEQVEEEAGHLLLVDHTHALITCPCVGVRHEETTASTKSFNASVPFILLPLGLTSPLFFTSASTSSSTKYPPTSSCDEYVG